MAIHLEGTFNSVDGPTEDSYIRIEFFKVKPWAGSAEYNPFVFLSSEDAADSRIKYFQDTFPNQKLVYLRSMSLDYSGSNYPIHLEDFYEVPLTGSAEEVIINHYVETLTSESFDVVDFDIDGNEIITQEWTYSSQSILYSSSIEYKNPIVLDNLNNIYNFCYDHLKGVLASQIPSSSIKDI